MDSNYQAKITTVSRKRPDFVVSLFVSGHGSGGGDSFLINLKCLELLMRHFGAKNHRELSGKTFESEEIWPVGMVFRQFFLKFYPEEKGIKIDEYSWPSPKYSPEVWTITAIHPPKKHFLFGPGEEYYHLVRIEYHKRGYSLPWGSMVAYIRDKTLHLIMRYFGVKTPEELIGKEFRANVGTDAQAAILILALKSERPELV